MRNTSLFSITFVLLFAAVAVQAEPPFTSPVPQTWIVSACETWNTAAVAMIMANGEPTVMAIPTDSLQHPWLVLRRIPAGSIFIPEDAPFLLETFDSMTEASSRFIAVDAAKTPMMLTTTNGETLVIYARETQRRRSLRH